jgi:hypothetical protein
MYLVSYQTIAGWDKKSPIQVSSISADGDTKKFDIEHNRYGTFWSSLGVTDKTLYETYYKEGDKVNWNINGQGTSTVRTWESLCF